MVLYQTKTLLFQGYSGTKLKETLIKPCESSTSIESTESEVGSSSPVHRQDNNIETVLWCKCLCVTGILTELESMKLKIVESRTDELQSLASAHKISFAPDEYSSEIYRLKLFWGKAQNKPT